MNAFYTDPFCHLGQNKMASEINKFISNKLDLFLSYYDIYDLYENKDSCIDIIIKSISNGLYSFIVNLYLKNNPLSTTNDLIDIRNEADLRAKHLGEYIKDLLTVRVLALKELNNSNIEKIIY